MSRRRSKKSKQRQKSSHYSYGTNHQSQPKTKVIKTKKISPQKVDIDELGIEGIRQSNPFWTMTNGN